jgi:hypothetical protein
MTSQPPPVHRLTSTASVPTERAGRYAKQLCAHLGRRLETSWDEETGIGSARFAHGECTLTAAPAALILEAATSADVGDLEQIENVVGRHLVRFGTRDELVVQWQRGDGSAGGTYTNDDEPEPGHTPPGA